jgi:hypothetical protein
MVAEHHYIVSNNGGVWQYSALGSTFAHFESEQAAINAAIAAAREAGEPEAQVIVQETNKEQATVWRASDPG